MHGPGETLTGVEEPVDVQVLEAGRAGEPLLSRLTAIVNAAYAIGEDGLWRPGVSRTDHGGLAAIAARGELAVARSGGAAIGCVRMHHVADDEAEIGLLATDPAHQGHGAGSALMDLAEDRARSAGRTSARLDLLVPVSGNHPAKDHLAGWYARRGYAVIDRTSVTERHPELVDDLLVPCDMLLWRKTL